MSFREIAKAASAATPLVRSLGEATRGVREELETINDGPPGGALNVTGATQGSGVPGPGSSTGGGFSADPGILRELRRQTEALQQVLRSSTGSGGTASRLGRRSVGL